MNFALNLKWISVGFVSCIIFVLFISIHSILKSNLRKATLQDFCYQSMKCDEEKFYWRLSLRCSLILLFCILLRRIYLLNYSIMSRLFCSCVAFGFTITILRNLPLFFAQIYPYFSFLISVAFVYFLSIVALDISYTLQMYSLQFAAKSTTMKYLITGLIAFLGLYVVAWDIMVYNSARYILIFIPLGIQLSMMILPYFVSCCCSEVYTFGVIVPTFLALYSDHFISYLPWNAMNTSKRHQETHSFSIFIIIVLFFYGLFINYRRKHSIFDSFANFLLPYLPLHLNPLYTSQNISLAKSEESIEILEKSRLQEEKHSNYYDTMTTIHSPSKSKSVVNHHLNNNLSPEQGTTILVEENQNYLNNTDRVNKMNEVNDADDDENEEETTESNPFLEEDGDENLLPATSGGSASSSSTINSSSNRIKRKRFEFDKISFFLFLLFGIASYYPWIAPGDFQLRSQLASTTISSSMKNWKISLLLLQWGSVWVIYFCSLLHRHRVYQHYLEHKQRLYRRHILKRPDELMISRSLEDFRQSAYLPSIV